MRVGHRAGDRRRCGGEVNVRIENGGTAGGDKVVFETLAGLIDG